MKLSSMAYVSIVTLAVVAFAADGAFAATSKPVAGMTTHGGSKGYGVTDRTTCPTGQVLSTNPTTGKQSCSKPTATILDPVSTAVHDTNATLIDQQVPNKLHSVSSTTGTGKDCSTPKPVVGTTGRTSLTASNGCANPSAGKPATVTTPKRKYLDQTTPQ
jgi:hypothetical protein